MAKCNSVTDVIIYIIDNLSKQNKSINAIKLTKLIYLSDKHHLINYNKPITNDQYTPTVFGPVGEIAQQLLNGKTDYSLRKCKAKINKHIKSEINYLNIANNVKNGDLNLSATNKQSIDFVLEHFSNLDLPDLIKYLKNYPEYHKFKHSHKPITTEEMQSTFDGDLLFPNNQPKQISQFS